MSCISDFVDTLEDAAKQGKTAFVIDGEPVSYQSFLAGVHKYILFFEQQGLKPQDRIIAELPNSLELLTCYFCCVFRDWVIVPVAQDLSDAQKAYYRETADAALDIVSVDQLPSLNEENKGLEIPDLKRTDKDVFGIFFTSGTTSNPKGVCHLLERMIGNVQAFNQDQGLDHTTRMMHVMPMTYMAGFLNTVLSPLAAGGCVIIAPQFNAQTALHFWKPAIQGEANTVWMSPSMAALVAQMSRDAEVQEWVRDNMQHVFVGTAPYPASVRERFEAQFGVVSQESYGMSEVLLVACESKDSGRPEGSVGRLLSGIVMHNAPHEDETMAELLIQSSYIMAGYWSPETKSADTGMVESDFPTGDVGYLDENGHLFITGRKKDLIIKGGMNLSPRAIEDVIAAHPAILDVAVVGEPHQFWGEDVVAFVRLADEQDASVNKIEEFAAEKLSKDQRPGRIIVVEDMPKSNTGKIQKHKLLGHL